MTSTARQTTAARRTRIGVCGALAAAAMLAAASPAAADPAVSEQLSDVTSARWDGPATDSRLADSGRGLSNVGDINGDGRDDIAAMADDRAAGNSGAYVFFTPPSLSGVQDLATGLPPAAGYRLQSSSLVGFSVSEIGDQNGDDVPDVLIGRSTTARVVYGVRDPSTLPECSPPAVTRCLDVDNLTPAQGYEIVSGITSSDGFANGTLANAGDVNDDGVEDMLFGAFSTGDIDALRGAAYVLYGGRAAPEAGTLVDLSTLPASEAVRINGPEAGAAFGFGVNGVGDLDGDGHDDFTVHMGGFGGPPSTTFVIYGSALGDSPMSTDDFGPNEGFRIATQQTSVTKTAAAGDVNGDGRPDLVLGGIALVSPNGLGAIIYGPAEAPADPISALAPSPEQGYAIAPGEPGTQLGGGEQKTVGSLGDLNGDGVPDQLLGAPTTAVDGTTAGAANIVFGARPTPANPVELGPSLTPDTGIALVGTESGGVVGKAVASAGDIDNDGLPDVFVAAPRVSNNGISQSGSIYLVLGRDLVGEANTGQAGSVDTSSATLGGSGKPNGRPSVAYFEYGTTQQFGEQTPDQDIGGNNATQSVDADVDGLQPNTSYRYRLVVENELGLKRYGGNRTFTTDATPTPTNGGGGGGGAEAGLDVTANPPSKKAKAKKKARFTAMVRNTGGAGAQGVQVCAESSKKGLKGGECQSLGALAGKASAERSFTLKARKKGKHNLTFTATAEGVGDATDTATLQVKKKKKGKRK